MHARMEGWVVLLWSNGSGGDPRPNSDAPQASDPSWRQNAQRGWHIPSSRKP